MMRSLYRPRHRVKIGNIMYFAAKRQKHRLCGAFLPKMENMGWGKRVPRLLHGILNLIHRLTLMSATAFDSAPHSATILVTMEIFRIDFKGGCKYVFFSAIVPALNATVAGLLCELAFG